MSEAKSSSRRCASERRLRVLTCASVLAIQYQEGRRGEHRRHRQLGRGEVERVEGAGHRL
jgi:hypothetical protein